MPVWADETQKETNKSSFSLDIKDNLINLQVKQTGFKEILKDLEEKTGIKVNVFDSPTSKKVATRESCFN
jgi:hypothetical protein